MNKGLVFELFFSYHIALSMTLKALSLNLETLTPNRNTLTLIIFDV